MTENQVNYVHFLAQDIHSPEPNATHYYELKHITYKCVLHGTKEMHVSMVMCNPKDQPNRKLGNKYVDERMEQYLLTGKPEYGYTVTYQDVINEMKDDFYFTTDYTDVFCLLDAKKLLEHGDFTFFKSSYLKHMLNYMDLFNNKTFNFLEALNKVHRNVSN